MLAKKLVNWKLEGYYPYVPHYQRTMETGQLIGGMMRPVDASVPGSVYSPLIREGLIPDPYLDMNSLACEWIKDRWWMYANWFNLPEELYKRHLRLRIEGMDYGGEISLNGKSLGKHENMYTPFVVDINDKLTWEGDNFLSVLLYNAPEEMSQIGHTSRTFTQKARFSYKWDFSTRLVQLGLHEPVIIEDFGACAIEYAKISSEIIEDKATVYCALELHAFEMDLATVVFTLYDPFDKQIAEKSFPVSLSQGKNLAENALEIENPELWYPNGYGEQPLYKLHVKILDKNGLSDEKSYTVGIRSMAYQRCEGASKEALPYRVLINNKPVYIKGVNMVPLDQMYGDISDKRYEDIVKLMYDGNVNLVRVWGGGLIEREVFYELCDRHGIMVWQEFIQSSSGIDNEPSVIPAFLEKLAATAEHAIKVKRNHVCLTFWCGGNELAKNGIEPSTYADENVGMLHKLVQKLNPEVFMLPTSASGPSYFIQENKTGVNHDVHGPWKYYGVTSHYTLYNNSDSMLHSEFGVDAMNSLECVERALSPSKRRISSADESMIWRHHGSQWWDTVSREEGIFGAFDKNNDLELFIKCSQFMQAEGLRYALEANRRRAFQNAGSIVWQLNEPWPNVSATNLVDYYLNPKLAYYAASQAYNVVNASLRYNKLVYSPDEAFSGEIWLTSDLASAAYEVLATVEASGQVIAEQLYSGETGDGKSARFGELHFTMPAENGVNIRLTTRYTCGVSENNIYLLVSGKDGFCKKSYAASAYDAVMGRHDKV